MKIFFCSNPCSKMHNSLGEDKWYYRNCVAWKNAYCFPTHFLYPAASPDSYSAFIPQLLQRIPSSFISKVFDS